MYLPIPAFPDSAKNIAESRDPEFCKNPVNEEDDRQIGDDEIVSQDDAQA